MTFSPKIYQNRVDERLPGSQRALAVGRDISLVLAHLPFSSLKIMFMRIAKAKHRTISMTAIVLPIP